MPNYSQWRARIQHRMLAPFRKRQRHQLMVYVLPRENTRQTMSSRFALQALQRNSSPGLPSWSARQLHWQGNCHRLIQAPGNIQTTSSVKFWSICHSWKKLRPPTAHLLAARALCCMISGLQLFESNCLKSMQSLACGLWMVVSSTQQDASQRNESHQSAAVMALRICYAMYINLTWKCIAMSATLCTDSPCT